VSWLDEAACRGTLKTEAFFDRDSTRSALAVCRACEVLQFCRDEGDAIETFATTFGIRGGETESARMRRRWGNTRGGYVPTGNRPGPARKPIKHGTRAGAQAHRRRGEVVCDACKAADALASAVQGSEGSEVVITHRRKMRAAS
jgi:hypothetical protein